jgi:pantetheine-phosphate adenylyltransferase
MKKAFFGGSFDPITLGHENMIERASKLCDKLTIGVLINNSKSHMFSLDEREEMVKAVAKRYPNVDVVCFEGLLAEYVYKNGFDCIVRGLRNREDFDYELQLSQIYASYPDVPCETIYLMTDPRYSFISSTVVRENFSLGADISNLVSKEVYDLMKKYNE